MFVCNLIYSQKTSKRPASLKKGTVSPPSLSTAHQAFMGVLLVTWWPLLLVILLLCVVLVSMPPLGKKAAGEGGATHRYWCGL